MSPDLQTATAEILELLMTLNRDCVLPPEAKTRLRQLQTRHPDLGMQLVWEQEAFDGSVHYDVLLRLPDHATVSLSHCPDRVLPWPLRGTHRWSEGDLVRVNQSTLRVDQVVACLDFIWNEAPVMNRLVNACLIQDEFDRRPLQLTDAQLQQGMDSFRRGQGLYTADETHRWMRERGMTQEQLERLVSDNLAIALLRDHLTAARVEPYFAGRAADFDTACIVRLDFADETSATQTWQEIQTGQLDFHAAAGSRFVAGSPAAFQRITRHEATPDLTEAVFAATPGTVTAPIQERESWVIAQVLSVTPGVLDERTRAAIKQLLFDQWLAERRQAARIEWFWGNAERAPATAG